MIYMVHCALGLEQTEAEWDAWYGHMKPPSMLLAVPGFRAAQRFKGITRMPAAYLAIYSVESAEVMNSPAYKAAGGGNFLTEQWKPMITFWHRMLFDGIDVVPPVPLDEVLLVHDADQPEAHPGLDFIWLHATGLDRPTPYRGLARASRSAALAAVDRSGGRLMAYEPRMPQLKPE
jgi:hypothetical protein